MQFESLTLPSQAVVPLGVALAHLILVFFVLFRRRFHLDTLTRIFLVYLLVTILWNLNLVATVTNVLAPSPNLAWIKLLAYGLLLLGLFYWTFSRTFLQRSWRAWRAWLLGGAGLGLMISLDMKWLFLPAKAFIWSNGWVYAENITFVMGVTWWAIFMGLALLTAIMGQFGIRNPAHRNRIQFLIISNILLLTGYILYLTVSDPFWTTGLIITWLGCALISYIIISENLLDLSTGIRQTINVLILALVTIGVYIAGIYLVQIFLGDFLTSTFLINFLNPTLLVAAVTALFLTVIYTPVRKISQSLTNRTLFGRSYNYQMVIQDYTQKINNILYLNELVTVMLTHIKQTLHIQEATLLILDSETPQHFLFRFLPQLGPNGVPRIITLNKETPITQRLAEEGKPLAQYTIDISQQFKTISNKERETLNKLNFEWFIPILKKETIIGIFALGTKTTKRSYSAKDMRLLTTLADQTALALENARLVDRLQRNLEKTTRMKNLMDNVFDSMDNGVVTTDLVGRITLFNKAAETILVLPPACIGQPYIQVIPSLTNTIFPKLVNNVIEHENHYTDYEIISDLPNRGKVNLNMNLVPLKDADDQTQGVAMIMDDITETKRLEAVQDMFRRYVSPAVVDRLPADASELELGGHRQEISVLFADIRGFTSFSENLSPEKLVDTLNEYLSMAAASILMYEGTLDKFMGDAVMGIFNAPLEQEDHILRAVRAAMAMQRAIADFHLNMAHNQQLSFGIGLHVGEAVVGNVGMSDRMDYTAIGDTVNLAKRIQENTPGGKILISDVVYEGVKNSVEAIFYEELHVKGREQSVNTYEVKLKT